ncbi:hypothetical protein SPHI_26590 [Sphingomonas jeddahensis]|uniref:Nickel/cobalt transporter regulator n=2 Tax=Sphingomonas jeddahensis TaxID=1915074 RepID=A0A1V2ERA3_9SPHN|nr:hypothetical protein SPHI_26590 [Sphingomonas jeddahensis]
MGRKLVAALMAAAALLPGMAVAQDRGGDRGGRAERSSRPQGGWQQRQGGDEAARMRRAQQQAPTRNYRPLRAPEQRVERPRTEAGRVFRQERREERRDFNAERWRDREALSNGAVTRQTYRADRAADREAFRRDRRDDRRDFTRDRRSENRGGWDRSGADRNDHYRDDVRRRGARDQRQWYGRNNRAGWNRDWRRDNRYDWLGWRASNRNAFRLPRYYPPYGWNQGYRRFGIGATLSSVLFAQSYWINDPWSYRLPATDGDFQWVRYYNDALLVDTYTGEVVDVITDIFW